uniref:G-protein coupled receptors family 1 profile domain-containing protein n=1 Tax=Loxodonta africana TaxID=9785 RepID=G3UCG9_LOXAF
AEDERIMDLRSHSSGTEFILSGLTEQTKLQLPLIFLFLGIYVVLVLGNLGMITLTGLSSHLHTPMYCFLSSLSFTDLCQSTVITPKMLVNFVTEEPNDSEQLYFFIIFAVAECHMLSAMAYDCYAAICNPLFIMLLLCLITSASGSQWGVHILCITGSTIHTGFMLELFFCKTNVVKHYFCDLFPLLELSCSSIYINELLVLDLGAFNILTPSLTIVASYIFIISSILHITSTEGRSKASSTLLVSSWLLQCFKLSNFRSMDQGKVSSVLCTIVPVLNPMIYSHKNKNVKFVLKEILENKACS